MGDYSAGHITTEEAKALVEDFARRDRERGRSGFSPASATATSWTGRAASRTWRQRLPTTYSDKEVIDYMPAGEGSKTIIKLMSDSQIFLKDASGQQGPR